MEKLIRDEIVRFAAESPENRFPDSDRRYFDDPLVGFAAAADPIFTEFKTLIGSFHLTPPEIFTHTFGSEEGQAASVICWLLPITEDTRKSNRKETFLPSLEWAQTRSYGAKFNVSLGRHLVSHLENFGHRAVVPLHSPLMQVFGDTPVGLASSWSERHAAYAAGLGTFSLNCGFISERGITIRCGSIVTDLVLSPSKRTDNDPWGNCLHYHNGRCGSCIKRCPVGAISRQGLDKTKCYKHAYGTVPQTVGKLYGVTETGCGLCQTKVPCESRIPIACRTEEKGVLT
ncbi:MAG: iron-sulfur cluster-binding oxidoreductase [Acidobacteria bacterium]|nr:iron-sulfur cluster-binding oxidoreductase [Acidobacteriota bacterium]